MHETASSDLALWDRLLTGDTHAFGTMMRDYYPLLFRYGSKFSSDRVLVQDSIQDVFLEVWEKRSVVNREIPPRPYLMASLRRRIHRLTGRHLLSLTEADEHLFDIEFSVEHTIIESETARKTALYIRSLLSQLPRRQQEVVYLKFFNDMSRDEIAEVMHIAPQTVSNLLQNAVKWLKVNWNTNFSATVYAGLSCYFPELFLAIFKK